MLTPKPTLYQLEGGIQHYAWGHRGAIPQMLGIGNPHDQPHAEYWMGAHADMPSLLIDPSNSLSMRLDEAIGKSPETLLGKAVCSELGNRLPFLFKVLAAAQPLSIQVHPSKDQARQGYAAEMAQGRNLDPATRLFSDDNHKPEIIIALEPFYGLCGFRPWQDIKEAFLKIPQWAILLDELGDDSASTRKLYERVMRLEDLQLESMLAPAIEQLRRLHNQSPFKPSDPAFWFLRASDCLPAEHPWDRGLFSVFMLNLICLQPGESIFIPSGILHAYLQGVGMELMANSNNVLRGGLTPKHMDVDALLKHIDYQSTQTHFIKPSQSTSTNPWSCYAVPAREFECQHLNTQALPVDLDIQSQGPEIWFMNQDQGEASQLSLAGQSPIDMRQGQAVFISAGTRLGARIAAGVSLYRALVPLSK